jgi:hypothetical protein
LLAEIPAPPFVPVIVVRTCPLVFTVDKVDVPVTVRVLESVTAPLAEIVEAARGPIADWE